MIGILSVEAAIATADPSRGVWFDWLSGVLQHILAAISNFDPGLPDHHRARNFIAIASLFFPVKVWCLYLWILRPEERRWILVTPLSGRSIISSVLILFLFMALTIVGSFRVASFGDPYWTDPTKVSPLLGQVAYPWVLRGGLLMWLSWSGFIMTGLAIFWAILLATARDWVLYIKNLGWRK